MERAVLNAEEAKLMTADKDAGVFQSE